MAALLRDSPDDLNALIGQTAAAIGYPEAWVEKDYWITEVLRSLSNPYAGATVIFKGGTSLSKVWRIIRRMSEDVDILLACDPGMGAGARDAILRAVTDRVGTDLGIEPKPVTRGKGTHRNSTIEYGRAFGDITITDQVLLEIGVRGGPEPVTISTISSFVAEHAVAHLGVTAGEYREFAPFQVAVLNPERTLLEKLAALHHLATAARADHNEFHKIGTSMRHYYDVAMLVKDETTKVRLRDAPSIETIVADIDARSEASKWPFTPRPAGGYAESPAFSPPFIEREEVVAAYTRALELVVDGPKPALTEVSPSLRSLSL